MRTQNGVVVEGIHLEVPGPRAFEFGFLESRDAVRERRPQAALEGVVVRLQRLLVQVIGRRKPGDEFFAFGHDEFL